MHSDTTAVWSPAMFCLLVGLVFLGVLGFHGHCLHQAVSSAVWCVFFNLKLSSYLFLLLSFALFVATTAERCAAVRGLLGQEMSGLNYTDALIRALRKVVLLRCVVV